MIFEKAKHLAENLQAEAPHDFEFSLIRRTAVIYSDADSDRLVAHNPETGDQPRQDIRGGSGQFEGSDGALSIRISQGNEGQADS